jgi:hypothetical protein
MGGHIAFWMPDFADDEGSDDDEACANSSNGTLLPPLSDSGAAVISAATGGAHAALPHAMTAGVGKAHARKAAACDEGQAPDEAGANAVSHACTGSIHISSEAVVAPGSHLQEFHGATGTCDPAVQGAAADTAPVALDVGYPDRVGIAGPPARQRDNVLQTGSFNGAVDDASACSAYMQTESAQGLNEIPPTGLSPCANHEASTPMHALYTAHDTAGSNFVMPVQGETAGSGQYQPGAPCSHHNGAPGLKSYNRVAPCGCCNHSVGNGQKGSAAVGSSQMPSYEKNSLLSACADKSASSPAADIGRVCAVVTKQRKLEPVQQEAAKGEGTCTHQAAQAWDAPLDAAKSASLPSALAGFGSDTKQGSHSHKRVQDHRQIIGSIHRNPALASRGERVPEHPCLCITYNSVQVLTSRYIRRLVVMKKCSEYEDAVVDAWKASLGPAAMAIDKLHDAVYQSQAKSSERPKRKQRFRGKTQ